MELKVVKNDCDLQPLKYKQKKIDVNGYKFVVSSTIFEEKKLNSIDNAIRKKRSLIEIKHLKSGLVLVHPFTSFVFLWKSKSYNTMRNKANTICRFLNYIIENYNTFKINSFCDLSIEHGVDYLTNLTLSGCDQSYFFSERNTLDKFYFYLAKKELLNNIDKSHFEKMEVKTNKKKNTVLPSHKTIFDDATQPSNIGSATPLHHIREELIVHFLETAIEVCPRIALGIFFEIRGGIRASEVICTSFSGVSFDDWGIKGATISLHEEIISNNHKHTYQACIKKKRYQEVHNFGDYLPRLLKMHYIEKKYFSTDGSNALFSNKKGRLLTPQMYNYYFNKVKYAFINKLISSPSKEVRHYGMFLKLSKWSSHIGRGIASNFIADSNGSEYQLARFRGDSNLSSAIVYIEDSSKFKDSIYESGSKMYEKGLEMHDVLNRNNISIEDNI